VTVDSETARLIARAAAREGGGMTPEAWAVACLTRHALIAEAAAQEDITVAEFVESAVMRTVRPPSGLRPAVVVKMPSR
jgi:hypothetical protein